MWTSIIRALKTWGYVGDVKYITQQSNIVNVLFKDGRSVKLSISQQGNTRTIGLLK